MLVAPFPPTSPNKIYITGTGTGYISAACETPNRRRRRPRHDKFSMNRWADRPCDAYRLVYPDDRLKPICARVCVCVCRSYPPIYVSDVMSSDKGQTDGRGSGQQCRADGISDISRHLPGVGGAVAVAALARPQRDSVGGRRR